MAAAFARAGTVFAAERPLATQARQRQQEMEESFRESFAQGAGDAGRLASV